MDQIRGIRTFLKVLECGGFAGAARALDQSPAVVTRVVAELERHLGARLLHRTTRHVALTPAGEHYAERTRQVIAELEEADALTQEMTSLAAGHLRVQVPPAFAVHQLVPDLPRFHTQYPGVTLELQASGPVSGVDGDSDLSIVFVAAGELKGDYVARPLARADLVLCASPEYLARKGRPGEPRDLESLDALIPPLGVVRRGVTFFPATREVAHQPPVVVQPRTPVLSTMHLESVYAAALAGIGIAGLPSFMAVRALHEGRLSRVLGNWHVAAFSLHVGVPSRRFLPARTRALRDFLLSAYGGDLEHDPWLASLGMPAPSLDSLADAGNRLALVPS